jgi:hypothetical protein
MFFCYKIQNILVIIKLYIIFAYNLIYKNMKKMITLTIDENLLFTIDEKAKKENRTRSNFIESELCKSFGCRIMELKK